MSYNGGARTQTHVDSKDCALKQVHKYFHKRTGVKSPKIYTLSGKKDVPLSQIIPNALSFVIKI